MKRKRTWVRRFAALGLSLCLAAGLSMNTNIRMDTEVVMAETIVQITPGVTNVNVRQGASTSTPSITKINGGQRLTILDQPNAQWYHVSFEKVEDGASYTGYVYAEYVSITETGGSQQPSADENFEAYLTAQGFPESYKPYLRELHAKHSDWKFVAVQTGLDWSTVIENERNKQGQIKNLIYGSGSAPHYNWRETSVGYNWRTDTWSPYDGKTWFAASKDIVSYYMDPRTYLYETYIFAFEQLSYDKIHNAAGVEAVLANTFMWNSYPAGENRTFSTEIMEAAAEYNVSPYHLASRMRQEMGTTAGDNATGNSENYPGIFNFFNIGSVDSAGGGAVNKGLAWASIPNSSYGRPWNSAYKAIMGGAQFIGASYINRGQDTLYTQKFNVTYTGNLYGHQYMSNVQAPATEARSIYNAYSANGLINSALVFKIPVYNNMPEQAVAKPADSGSPNNWLASLGISGYSLTPSFDGGTTEYSLIVENSVTSVAVSAAAVRSGSGISGTGAIGLSVGTNTIPVTVTAQNGSTRTYTITVVRKNESGGIPDTPVRPNTPEGPKMNTSYRVSGTQVSGISVGSDASTVISGLGLSSGTATVYKADGATVNTGAVGTGNIIRITDGSSTYSYTVMIYGDVSGDGEIGIRDLVSMKKQVLSQGQLEGAYFIAADIDGDGKITIKDLVTVKKHILGQQSISQ